MEPKFDLDREVERIILSRYGPPGFIVDDRLHILKFRGRTRPYLDPSPGEPSLNLLKMIRPELASEVRSAIQQARRESTAVRRNGLSVRLNGRSKEVDLQVHPVSGAAREHWYLVLLEEVKTPSKNLAAKLQRDAAKPIKGGAGVDRRAILQLKRDLSASRRQLRTITAEAEAAKEELQSANEELTTLNETLRNRNDEMSHSNTELEKARAYSESIVETVRYPLLVLDSELRVHKANRAFYKGFDINGDDTIGKHLHELASGQWDIPALRDMLEKLISMGGQFVDFETHRPAESGGFRDYILDARRLEGSQQEGQLVLLSISDVTEVKRAKEVEKQRTELARSNQDLEQFAHAASHDLREPLRMVISFLQMISDRYSGKLDEQGAEWIRYAVEGAERMQHLIGDLLAYAQVGKGHTPAAPASVDEILDEVLSNLETPIRESSAVIERGTLPRVPADRTEMVQLFQNLIGNAIKFRGAKPPVIRISARDDGRWWSFTVADNGIGIPPEHHERIFAMFQRLHDRAQYPGTGVGLAICRKIVDRLGGQIWVESADGAGSAFKFTIPIPAEQIRKSGGDSESVAG